MKNTGDIFSADDIIEQGKQLFDGLRRTIKKYRVSQGKIDDLTKNELDGISFSAVPVYNPKIRAEGKTSIHPHTGRILKIEIGLQLSDTKLNLMDTLIHEELEARIASRAFQSKKKWINLFDERNEALRHHYISKIIARYFRMRGISR